MQTRTCSFVVAAVLISVGAWLVWPEAQAIHAQPKASEEKPAVAGWKQGAGWGWIWGKDDQRGALNAQTSQTVLAAMQVAKSGKVYDLGVTYSRNSFKWPGHAPGEVISFRTPEGVKRQQDAPFAKPDVNAAGVAWHSAAIFISDNVGTQIDGLGHITVGADNHWYNGYREQDWGGNFGIRKCDAPHIPPIIARGVMLDIAALKGVDVLPTSYVITPGDLQQAIRRQKVEPQPGGVIFIRTGTLSLWGLDGANTDLIKEHDKAGINLPAAKYLVETFGPVLIGSDTSGLEVTPQEAGADCFIPVHKYLLVEQGVYIGEFHNLEELAKDKAYEFCYIATVPKIAGAAAGFAMRPVAIR